MNDNGHHYHHHAVFLMPERAKVRRRLAQRANELEQEFVLLAAQVTVADFNWFRLAIDDALYRALHATGFNDDVSA